MAVIVVASIVFATTELRGASAPAFATADALAALSPGAGKIIHTRLRAWAKIDGESKPIVDGSEYEEVWIDFKNHRERSELHSAKTGETIRVSITANGRTRYLADDFETREKDDVLGENYASGPVGLASAWPYFYLRTFLPHGKVVGEVVCNGQTFWDIRWENVEDDDGLALNGRALLHQGDYRPALIERHYPGGARERWEVLAWEALPARELQAGLLDPSSLGTPETPIASAWQASTLKKTIGHPCYWAGPKIGRSEIVSQLGEIATGARLSPLLIVKKGFAADIAKVLGDTYVEAWYAGSSTAPLTIATAAATPQTTLAEKIQSLTPEAEPELEPSNVGQATIVRLESGNYLAGIATPDASVVIVTKDLRALDATLESLRPIE